MNTEKLKIAQIRIDGGTQPRESIDQQSVTEYADAMAGGCSFPALTVFRDGADLWLADGFHRMHAMLKLGFEDADCDVRTGTQRDAILHSLGANDAHGLRRSAADKRKAVNTMLADPEWSQWSRNKIAQWCHVSEGLVSNIRAEREPVTGHMTSESKFESKHGTPARMDTSAIVEANKARKPAPPTQPVPQPAPGLAPELPQVQDTAADTADLREQLHEAQDVAAELAAEVETLRAAGSVEGAEAEIGRLRAMLRAVEAERDMYRTKSTEMLAQIKAMQRKIAQMERGK